MRTTNTNLFETISNDQMQQMVKEVKETVATGLVQDQNRPSFSAAELWKIQKNRRQPVQRRVMFY